MKPTFLILVILGLFNCCWARKKDPDHFRLDANHAKNFLLHKRGTGNKWCEEYQIIAEQTQEEKGIFRWGKTPNVYEECCKEGCRAEEIRESDPHYMGNFDTRRNAYVEGCCKYF